MAGAIERTVFSRGDVISKKYEVEEHLGEGMMGSTYLVQHIKSGKHVALKFLVPSLVADQRDRQRFEEAFKSAKAVKHDGLIRFGEIGEHNGQIYFTQEYFKSQSLRELLDEYADEQKSFTLQEACQIILKVLDAVRALHAGGIVHRNLKPENILVHSQRLGPGGSKVVWTIKVTDQGIADIINPTIFAEGYMQISDEAYIAPEISSFELPGTPPTDVYSCGVVLYELLVGQSPRGTYLAPTQLRGDLPDEIDDIVELAMEGSPADRYPTAEDMSNHIQQTFSGDLVDEEGLVSIRNVLIVIGLVILIIGGFGGWRAMNPPAPDVDQKQMDAELRAQMIADNPPLSEAIIATMNKGHEEMLYVPGGTFIRGRLHHESTEVASQSEPLAEVAEVPDFFIDRYEFPNATQGKDGQPVKPVVKVTWDQAKEACEKFGKRLCTADEWEKACKGPNNTIYSYGDDFDEVMCGKDLDEPYNIGDRKHCVSGYGVGDLSGGLREWTSTNEGSKGTRRTVKGGLRANHVRGSRCAFAVGESAKFADGTLGFRCCLDVTTGGGEGKEEAPAE